MLYYLFFLLINYNFLLYRMFDDENIKYSAKFLIHKTSSAH